MTGFAGSAQGGRATERQGGATGGGDGADAFEHIGPAEFDALDRSAVTLLDLREPDEVLVHGVEGAINIPFDRIGTGLGRVPRDRPVVVFCRVGDWSEQVCEILADRGYHAVNLDGGFQAWRDYVEAQGRAVDDAAAAGETTTAAGGATDDKAGAEPAGEVFVDAKGLKCPGPIVRIADTLRPLPIGTRAVVEATEDAFCSDVAVWCERTGNRLVDLRRDDDGVIHVVIDKTAAMPDPGSPALTCPAPVRGDGQTGAPACGVPANPDGGDIRHDKTFVVFSGDLDKTIAVFIMANGAAAMGRRVTVFFTFWGLNILRRPKRVRVRKSLVERMFGMMMPRGTRRLGLSRMNMGGIGARMIRWIMKSKNVDSLESLIEQARAHGVRLVACQMSMDIMGIRREELIDGVELGGVSTFLGSGETSDMSLFV